MDVTALRLQLESLIRDRAEDPAQVACFQTFLVVLDLLLAERAAWQEEKARYETTIAALLDEIARLKGRPRPPKDRRGSGSGSGSDRREEASAPPNSKLEPEEAEQGPQRTGHSSEHRRREIEPRKRWSKPAKKSFLLVHEEKQLLVDRATLPEGNWIGNGYASKIIQDIEIRCRNTLFKREVLRCTRTGRTITAPMPPGYEGGFGPGVKAASVALHYGCNAAWKPLAGIWSVVDG